MQRPTEHDYQNLPDQQSYARVLSWISAAGLILLFLSFGLYASGLVEPLVPFERLPELWVLPLDEFLAQSGAPTGWQWVENMVYGDYLNFMGIAILSSVSLVCYLWLLVLQIKNKNRLYLLLVIAELFLLILACSNLLSFLTH